MAKFMAGMLLAVFLQVAFVSPAGAAEIPPTATCSATMKKLLTQYFNTTNEDVSDAARKKAGRVLVLGLADAGCLSDPEPLIQELSLKPFSDQCRAASLAAGKFWKRPSRRLSGAIEIVKARTRPLNRRLNRINRRASKLQKNGASNERLRSLNTRRKAVVKKKRLANRAFSRKAIRILRPQAYETILIVSELISLRCLSPNFFEGKEEQKDPASRSVSRNRQLIQMSVFYVAIKVLGPAAYEAGPVRLSRHQLAGASGGDFLAPHPLASAGD